MPTCSLRPRTGRRSSLPPFRRPIILAADRPPRRKPKTAADDRATRPHHPDARATPLTDPPTAPLTSAQRRKRVFAIDITFCPLCGGALRVIGEVTDPDLTRNILDHLQQRAPRLAPRRADTHHTRPDRFAAHPEFEAVWFGHIGDGNLHLNILKPASLAIDEFFARCGELSLELCGLIDRHGGSISAEHDVGLLKKPYLNYSSSAEEISLMRNVETLFDPDGVMNPGTLLDASALQARQ